VAGICLIGFLLTGLATWATARVDQNTEERLLQTQTRQAASVLETAIMVIQQPMTAVLDAQLVLSPEEGAAAFGELFADYVGDDKQFVSASLWRRDTGQATRLESIGAEPGLDPEGSEIQSVLERALRSETSIVQQVAVGDRTHFAYVLADAETGFVVYAERAIPADRRAPVDRDSAFSDLHYAIYLGRGTDTADMTTTDVDPEDLPLTGLTHRETVPFGDTVLTLVASPRHHLGSPLSQRLPWLLLLTGLAMTTSVALVARQLLRSRQLAVAATGTITELYERVDTLYAEQRDVSVRLQRALLPRVNPDVPGVEIAAEYVAGGQGLDIGGDWYSAIALDEERFGFVVGDVSGHGIDAVAEMARARFTLRAYLFDGASPGAALEKCGRQFDISTDGHLVTALVGVGNRRTGAMTVASAGHPSPVLLTDGRARVVQLPVGVPLGTGWSSYASTDFEMPQGSTLVAFTDGLVERRGEAIDVGIQRLVSALEPLHDRELPDVISTVLDSLVTTDTSDDIAVLAIRRVLR
jgi:serine phosphatase RsbU (regulator of sigma subunit)